MVAEAGRLDRPELVQWVSARGGLGPELLEVFLPPLHGVLPREVEGEVASGSRLVQALLKELPLLVAVVAVVEQEPALGP